MTEPVVFCDSQGFSESSPDNREALISVFPRSGPTRE
jgi:hypothetical protein